MSNRSPKKASCGNCGHKEFSVAIVGDQDYPNEVEIKCLKCGSISVIKPQPVKLVVDFGVMPNNDYSAGRICVFPEDE